MPFWDDQLHEASLDGIRFRVRRSRLRGGRAKARHRYPGRDGQDIEDLGAEPRAWELEIPLYEGVHPVEPSTPLYPDTWDALRIMFDDPDRLGEVEYQDPELGPIQVAVLEWDADYDAEARHGLTLKLKIEERDEEPFLIRVNPDPRPEAELAAEELDDGLVDAGVTENEVLGAWADAGAPAGEFDFEAGELFVTAVDDFFDDIDAAALSADEAAAKVDRFRARLDAVLAFDVWAEAERWSIVQSILRLQDSVTEAGRRVVEQAPKLVDFTVPRSMSVWEVAARLYGDRGRAEEVLQRNPTRNPLFYPAGSVLRVLAA